MSLVRSRDPKGERSLSVLDDEMGVSGGGLEHVPGAGVIQADACGGKTWIVTSERGSDRVQSICI